MANLLDLYKNEQPNEFELQPKQQQTSALDAYRGEAVPQEIVAGETPEPAVVEQKFTEELPTGAIGMNPDGTPNYGEGFEGWLNGVRSRISEPITYKTVIMAKVLRDG